MSLKERGKDFLFWASRFFDHSLVSPEVIQIPMTDACNLKCAMCSIRGDGSNRLSLATIFDILDQAANMGIQEAVLTGGEPLLRKDFFEICGHCKDRGLRSILTTNGTLVDEGLAQAIVSSGLSHIHFSLDGLEEANDLVRGKGSFKKTIEGIKKVDALRKISKNPLSVGIACTVMDHNLEDLPQLMAYADALNVDAINFQPLLKDNANTPDRRVSKFWIPDERWHVLDETIEQIKHFKARHLQLYEEPDLRLLKKYYRRSLSRSDWKCFGGYKTLFVCIGDTGTPLVYTCHGICGDLSEKSLRECWASREAAKLRKSVKRCRDLCLQSCYSRERSRSLWAIGRNSYGK
ncbi:MAG: radical SAM protein [Candidatus Omnitrophota bacterium]